MNQKLNMLLLLLAAMAWGTVKTQAQDCKSYSADNSGSIAITIKTDTETCFELYYDGEKLTPEPVIKLFFNASAGSNKIKIKENGEVVIEKKILLSPEQATGLYIITKNKKGKYKLDRKLSGATLTADAAAKREAEEQKREEERKAEKARKDAEWDKSVAEQRERQRKFMDEPDYDTKQKMEREKAKQDSIAAVEAKAQADAEAKKKAERSNMSEDDQQYYAVKDKYNTVVVMRVLYNMNPVVGTKVTLEIDGVVHGSAVTNERGRAFIGTNKPVDYNTAYKVSGENGNRKWSFGGLFVLNPPPQESPVHMDVAIREMSSRMGMSESSLKSMWGF